MQKLSNILGSTAGGSEYISYSEKLHATQMLDNDVFHKALYYSSVFAKAFSYTITDGGDAEIDEYIKNLHNENNGLTLSFSDFAELGLKYIHYGYYANFIEFEKDENGLYFPSSCIGLNPLHINIDKFGKLYDENNKPLNNPQFILFRGSVEFDNILSSSLAKKHYENYLLLKNNRKFTGEVQEKYSLPSVVAFLNSSGNAAVDNEKTQNIAANLVKLRNKSAAAFVGVNDLKELQGGSLPDLDLTFQSLKREIIGGYIGNAEVVEPFSAGSQARMQVAFDVARQTAEPRNKILENAENKLIRLITDVRFGKGRPCPVKKYGTKLDTDLILKLLAINGMQERLDIKQILDTFGLKSAEKQ